jgi:hypothetical protein
MSQNQYEDIYGGWLPVSPEYNIEAAPQAAPTAAAPDYEAQLKDMAAASGATYDPSDYEGFVRNTTYNEPGKAMSPEQFMANMKQNYAQRGASNSGPAPVETPNAAAMQPNPAVSGFQNKLEGYLDKILSSGGMFDQGLVQRQKESVKDQLDTARMGRVKGLKADLAARGMLSLPGSPSGAEVGALSRLDESLGATYGTAIRDIFSGEQERASDRFMSAMGLGTNYQDNVANQSLANQRLGLDRELGMGRLGLDRMLGQSDIALRQMEQEIASRLGIGRLELDSETARSAANNLSAQSIREIVEQILRTTGTGAGGYFR